MEARLECLEVRVDKNIIKMEVDVMKRGSKLVCGSLFKEVNEILARLPTICPME